jgi:hypothetical protein
MQLIASIQLIGRRPTLFLKEFRWRNLPNSSQPDVLETDFTSTIQNTQLDGQSILSTPETVSR